VILAFRDHEGDPVAVDSAAIVGLSVGTINGPRKPDADVTVTLVWARGVAQPFMVAAPFAEVLDLWTRAREARMAHGAPTDVLAHPGVFPLVAHQYPGGAP
jgi:hypothetical protein